MIMAITFEQYKGEVANKLFETTLSNEGDCSNAIAQAANVVRATYDSGKSTELAAYDVCVTLHLA